MLVLESGDKLRGDASAAAVVDFTIHGIIGSTPTQFADGQLAAIIGDLYTSAGIVIVASITLVNTDSVARTVNLYLTPSGGTARRLIAKDLSLAAGYSLMFDGNKFEVIDTFGQIATTRTSALIGPAASTANAVVRFSGTTGKLAKDSTAVVIDDSNNVGIGTVSPSNPLHIKNTGELIIKLESSGSGDAKNVALELKNAAGTVPFDTYLQTISTDGRFRIYNNTEALTILQSGYVGIGSVAPAYKLEVDSASGTAIGIVQTDASVNVINADVQAGQAALMLRRFNGTVGSKSQVLTGEAVGQYAVGGYGTTAFGGGRGVFQVVAAEDWTDSAQGADIVLKACKIGAATPTEKVRITSEGNVGIGTASPGRRLTVFDTSNNLQVRMGYDDSNYWEIGRNNTGGQTGQFEFHNYWVGGGQDIIPLTISGYGNVGIGTTTFGANAVAVLGILNGTAPAAAVANEIQIYSVDTADATATLGLMLEQAVEAIGVFTASHKIKVFINGTAYWIQLDAV